MYPPRTLHSLAGIRHQRNLLHSNIQTSAVFYLCLSREAHRPASSGHFEFKQLVAKHSFEIACLPHRDRSCWEVCFVVILFEHALWDLHLCNLPPFSLAASWTNTVPINGPSRCTENPSDNLGWELLSSQCSSGKSSVPRFPGPDHSCGASFPARTGEGALPFAIHVGFILPLNMIFVFAFIVLLRRGGTLCA